MSSSNHLSLGILRLGLLLATLLVPGCHADQPTKRADGSVPIVTVKQLKTEKNLAFRFDYAFEIRSVPTRAKRARVWIPLPRNDGLQQARLVRLQSPAEGRETQDTIHGNRYMYFETDIDDESKLEWHLAWDITRRQWHGPSPPQVAGQAIYLKANRLVPTDGPVAEVAEEADLGPTATLRQRMQNLYAYLLDRMDYGKHGTGWGNGDAAWACSSRYGNCTDFHSVFIGVARHWKIPARFEIGFPLDYTANGSEIGGYHCWAAFGDSQDRWWPVDISEADKRPTLAPYFFGNLHSRRVHFTTGRDLVLVPAQQGPPLNYFIYPYVEIDGEPYDDVSRRFSYRIKGTAAK